MVNQRKKVWIDRFQTYLSVRIALYFIIYQAAVWFSVVILQGMFAQLRNAIGPLAIYFAIMLGGVIVFVGFLFIYDALLFTHRIVGPLYRLRKAIQAVAAGREAELITLRRGDFLQELKDEFNEMLKALEQRGALVLGGEGARCLGSDRAKRCGTTEESPQCLAS